MFSLKWMWTGLASAPEFSLWGGTELHRAVKEQYKVVYNQLLN